MTYEVLVENLRSAAGDYTTIASKVGDPVDVSHVTPGSLGHVELAAWLTAVVDQCEKATTALHDGAAGLAESLRAAARHYETTDEAVGQCFTQPLGAGIFSTPTGPVFGPASWVESGR